MNLLSHAATIIPVRDMDLALSFYKDKLGFDCSFIWEDPPSYVVLKSEDISIHLALKDIYTSQNRILLYIFSYDINRLYERLRILDIEFVEKLNMTDYGMKECTIKDPFGNLIAFGQHN